MSIGETGTLAPVAQLNYKAESWGVKNPGFIFQKYVYKIIETSFPPNSNNKTTSVAGNHASPAFHLIT